ncbi:MAG: TonB-dependent receptor [Gammaproteobacteria bacterium]|nr:TonB-dependent receptor [Gammaproteobacteria bacterium]
MNKLTYAISVALFCQAALANEEKCNVEKGQKCQKNVKTNKQSLSKLSTISVTANRMDTDVAKYAGQISILDNSSMQNSENIVENLTTIPGIQTGGDWGRMIGTNYNIRGFGYQTENRVIIDQDGIKRSTGLFSNHVSSFRTDTNLLKRVEVVKGASSILHGGGAIGGIISMRTKNAHDYIKDGKNIGFTIGARKETNNSQSGYLSFAVAPDNLPIDFLIYGKKSSIGDLKMADGGVPSKNDVVSKTFNDENINVGFIKIGYDVTNDIRASFSLYNYKEKINTVWQTLYHNYDFYTDPIKGKLTQKDYVLDLSYQPESNELIDFSAKVYKSDASYYREWTGKTLPKKYENYYDNKDSRWGISLKNTSQFTIGDSNHQIVAGLEYENRNEDAIFFTDKALVDFGSFPNYYKNMGLYIQDNMNLGIVDITLGGRYDTFKRGVKKSGSKSYSASHFSPKIAAAIEVSDGINLLAGYAETFRGPTPNETSSAGPLNPHYYYLPNQNLNPETAKEIEVGFSIDKDNIFTADDKLYVKATYFNGKIEDMISIKKLPELGKPPKSNFYAQYQNISNAHRKGVEIEGRYDINNWSFNLGYDHIKLYNEDSGKRISSFADKLSVKANYLFEPWNLNLGLQATHWFKPKYDGLTFKSWGKTYHKINRTFTIVNLTGKWAPKNTGISFFDDGFRLKFGVNNLFDKKYIKAGAVKNSTKVGKGRNAYLELEKTF